MLEISALHSPYHDGLRLPSQRVLNLPAQHATSMRLINAFQFFSDRRVLTDEMLFGISVKWRIFRKSDQVLSAGA